MDGRCGSCEHWAYDARYGAFGACLRTEVLQGRIRDPESLARADINLGMTSTEYTDVNRWLSTSPDFGCVQYSSREQAPTA